jgi:hypothetical protein
MGQVKFTWNGEEVKKRQREGRNKGLRMAVEHLLGEAIPLTPIRDNPLRNSGTTSVDKATGTAAVSFDTPYAVRQHEELTWRHEEGQAKYLEQPFNTEKATMLALIAAEERRALR